MEILELEGIFIRRIPLPDGVPGAVVPNEDATYDVYISEDLTDEQARKTVEHELIHIRRGHFYDSNPVCINEAEADCRKLPPVS